MSLPFPRGYYRAEAAYAELLRGLGLVDAMSVFEHPKIEPWRSITERENCVLDYGTGDTTGRLHIKRNKPGHTGVDHEAEAIRLLMNAKLPTVPLVAAGRLNDGRGFLITDNLAGYDDAEVRVRNGLDFFEIRDETAELAGALHAAGLHHRDLYLCHFYVRVTEGVTPEWFLERASAVDKNDPPKINAVDVRLMDAGRVRPLPKWFRRRWLVKDVAQFVYSIRKLGVDEAEISVWLSYYAYVSGTRVDDAFFKAVERKVAAIGRHDARLRARQPTRNVGIDKTDKGRP